MFGNTLILHKSIEMKIEQKKLLHYTQEKEKKWFYLVVNHAKEGGYTRASTVLATTACGRYALECFKMSSHFLMLISIMDICKTKMQIRLSTSNVSKIYVKQAFVSCCNQTPFLAKYSNSS
jgi:hypothetical protein